MPVGCLISNYKKGYEKENKIFLHADVDCNVLFVDGCRLIM